MEVEDCRASAMADYCAGLCNGKSCYIVDTITDVLVGHGVTIQRWIPVNERLPEKNKLVLCFKSYDGEDEWDMGVVCFRNERQFRIITGGATHWRYLPEPPKEGA